MKEIIEAFAARIKSPVFGYFVFWWIIFNWKPLFYLFFSNAAIDDRFVYFDKLTTNYSLGIFPLVVASIMAVLYPWINLGFLYLCKKPVDLRNYLQAERSHKLLLRKKQLEEAESVLLATKEKALIDRAKRDEEIQTIADEEAKEKLQIQIDNLRKEIDIKNEDDTRWRNKDLENDLIHTYKQMADVLTKRGDLNEAEDYLKKSIEIQQRLQNK